MNLLIKTQKFAALCHKVAQVPDTQLLDFAFKLMQFQAEPGTSVDVEKLKEAGRAMYSGIVLNKPAEVVTALKSILSLTHDGGGSLYQEAQATMNRAKQLLPKPPPPKPVSYLPAKYYQTLNELSRLAQEAKTPNADINILQKVKDRYKDLKGQMDEMNEHLDFIEATGITGKENTNDPNEKVKAEAKLKEINSFKGKLAELSKNIDNLLFGYAGSETPQEAPRATRAII